MCSTCGCGTDHVHIIDSIGNIRHIKQLDINKLSLANQEQNQNRKVVDLERNILDRNDRFAERLRGYFDAKNMFVINMVSSPGSGKTTILERTFERLGKKINTAVIEGDQQTSNDADRIRATGTSAIQINTGKGCHLDAEMVYSAVQQLQPPEGAILFIENVGNLVCPALFDLGENIRVVTASVTEGDDKPEKYPDMFRSAQYCIINKTDLLPYVPFDIEKFKNSALRIQPKLIFFETDALHGINLEDWINFISSKVKQPQAFHV